MRYVLIASAFTALAGCATAPIVPAQWPIAPPRMIALVVTGPEASGDKRVRCEQIAQEAGAMVAPTAPVIVTLNLADGKNRLTITTSGNHILLDESRPPWSTVQLCTDAIYKVAALYPRGSVRDFVSERVMRDPALAALLAGAGHAQAALHLAAETPIEELGEGSDKYAELQKAVGAAQDAYRRYSSYGRTLPASALSTAGTGLLSDPDFDGRVPIQGTGVVVRVDVRPDRVALLAVESDRGRTILSFDENLKATAAAEFRQYLIGDRVDVSGVVKRRIKRDAAPVAAKGEDADPSRASSPASDGGCTKDTDCKGDRICGRSGRCVSPNRQDR